jgi:iron(III) transport system substrate-binding protein
LAPPGCARNESSEVVAYVAQDQVYAEPLLREFTRSTGIRVRAVFDSEAVKTVGLANRLLAERSHPQCDVFWGNEELRARQLARRGVFRETNGWATFGARTRRLVVNTNRLDLSQAPRSLAELTNEVWRGRVALAYPLFGTTATHFLALRQHWGEASWQAWCRALQANRPFLVDGNSVVVNLVGRGEAVVGLTDSDDIAAAQREGRPVAAMPATDETLVIPNAVGVVRAAPHAQEAEALFRFLQRPEVVTRLVQANALEAAHHGGESGLKVDWERLVQELESATGTLRTIFLR